jgi:hypothetical protein
VLAVGGAFNEPVVPRFEVRHRGAVYIQGEPAVDRGSERHVADGQGVAGDIL